MSNGREQRSQIDLLTVKVLITMNGAAAVAVLHFTSTIIQKPELHDLVVVAAIAILLFVVGLVSAAHLASFHRGASLHTDLAHQAEDGTDGKLRHSYLAHQWSKRGAWFQSIAIGAFASGATIIPLWILVSANVADSGAVPQSHILSEQPENENCAHNHQESSYPPANEG